MNMSGLIGKMLMLLFFIVIGILCSKVRLIDEHGSRVINKIVLYVCAPALVIWSVLNTELAYTAGDILRLLLFGILFNVLGLLIGWGCSWLLCRKQESRGTFHLVTAFGNISFMGLPVIASLYGNAAVFPASICSLPFNLFIFSFGTMLALGGRGEKLPWKRMLLNPALIATVVALLIFFLGVPLPMPVNDAISYLANMVIPLAMLLIGSSLSRMNARSVLLCGKFYGVCLSKLLITPIVMYLILKPLVRDPLTFGILVIMSAMPSATMAPVLCTEYGGDSEFANGSVFLSTILSLVTVPLVIWLLKL